jgi:hypothetical protein
MRVIVTLALAAALCAMTSAATPTYPPAPAACSGSEAGRGGFNCSAERPESISVHTDAPVFVKSVTNGKRYLGGSGNDTFHVVHLYSETDNLYEMGFALGQLFPQEIADMFDTIEPWLERLLESAVPWLPEWLADLVIKYGAPVALDFVYDITKDYIPKDYLDEWAGIAAGANCSIERLRRVTLFPQASKAACTILVAHNNATVGGNVNQLRALDFDPTSEVANFASVVIYHYKNKPKLANFGWIGMTGVLTGMNDVPMTVGEKAWGGNHNAYLGLPLGLPWMQMLRQSLELRNLTAVDSYITEHNKASSPQPNSVPMHLGYGDQKTNKILGFEIGYNFSKSFDSKTHSASPTHPLFDGIVYWSKNDPAHTMCPADMLTAQYGSIDGEWMAMYYSPNDMTGDTQVAGFDLQQMKVWFANSRKTGSGGPLCAYYRQRTVLDMAALFGESQ